MTLQDAPLWITATAVLGIIVGAVLALWRAAPGARRIGHAIDDIVGEDARPGVPRRPGLVERMATLEDGMAQMTGAVSRLTNGTSTRLDEQGARLDEHGRRLDEHERRITKLSEQVDRHHPPSP